jgi:hypothetical protein
LTGRILFVLASPEYLRFFDRTIDRLVSRGHRVDLVVNDSAEHKPVGLEGARTQAFTTVAVLPAPRTFWADTAYAFRATVDFLRFLHRDFAAAPALRQRIRHKALPKACHWLDRIPWLPAPVLSALMRALSWGERALPIDPRVVTALAERHADLVVVSPLVDAASPQVDWLKAARAAGIPTALAVASWDNLTNKGLFRYQPDRVFVWNETQRREAVRYHGARAEDVVITGAPVFDRWFGRTPSRTAAEFRRAVGLSSDRPYVLFTGSSPFIADAAEETDFVRRWIQSLRESPSRSVRELAVLVRPHPYKAQYEAAAALRDLEHVAVWPRGAYNPADEGGREDFFDSIWHASVVVGINTSAMIEAAIIGRPVLTVPAFSRTQEGTLHFHYLLAEHGGPVIAAATLDEHVAQLAATLEHPEEAVARGQSFVASFVRPCGLSEPATDRLVDAIERTVALPHRSRPDRAAVVLRPAMLAFGVCVSVVQRITSDDPFVPIRKHVIDPARTLRKRAMRGAAAARERTGRGWRIGAGRARTFSQLARKRIRSAPLLVKQCRRGLRQARYTVGVFLRGGTPTPPARKS